MCFGVYSNIGKFPLGQVIYVTIPPACARLVPLGLSTSPDTMLLMLHVAFVPQARIPIRRARWSALVRAFKLGCFKTVYF